MYKINTFSLMMDFEGGEISEKNALKLFCNLIESGRAWSLQGFYGRTARELLDSEAIIKKGNKYIINNNI